MPGGYELFSNKQLFCASVLMQDRTLAIILKKQRGKTKEERGLEETAKLTRVRDKAKPQDDNLF